MKKAHTFELAIALLIVILACLLYIAVTPQPAMTDGWEASVSQAPDYMLPGSDGTLYAFTRNNVTAIDSRGRVMWTFDAQREIWNGKEGNGIRFGQSIWFYQYIPMAAEHSGCLYLLVEKPMAAEDVRKAIADNKSTIAFPMDLIALSPGGDISWERTINDSLPASGLLEAMDGMEYRDWPAYFRYTDVSSLTTSGDRLYVFHDGREDVLDANGTPIFTLQGLSSVPIIDERDYVYAVLAVPKANQRIASSIDTWSFPGISLSSDNTDLTPSSLIAAFRPDGSQAWSLDLGESVAPVSTRTGLYTDHVSRLFFVNHTLYVPLQNGVAAVSTEGRLLWVCHLPDDSYKLFESMPVDPEGNVYFQQDLSVGHIRVISPGGQVQASTRIFNFWSGEAEPGSKTPVFIGGKDGIVYGTGSTTYMSPDQFNETYKSGSLDPGRITAYDLAHNRTLWTFEVPAEDIRAILLTPENYEEATALGWGADIHPDDAGVYTNINQGRIINVYPGRDVTYVSYEYTIREDPIVLNQSRGMYVRELYAVDNSGRLLWKEPVGPIKQAAVSNDTLYYSTWGGQMGRGGGIAGGIAIIASLYLVLRFVAVGAVSRSKAALHVNENRNALLKYVVANPGSTAMEISQGLPMNLGTLRYHLLVLSANHKLVAHKDGDKYVRYFRNSGTYTREEQTLLSLLRREPIRKTVEALLENPGMGGVELSSALGVSTTAAYRHLNLLVEKQIVTRDSCDEQGWGYRIREEYLPSIEHLLGQP